MPAVRSSRARGAGLVWVLLQILLLLRDQAHLTELTWHMHGIVTPGLMSVVSLAIVAMLGMLGEAAFPTSIASGGAGSARSIHIYAVAWLAWFWWRCTCRGSCMP